MLGKEKCSRCIFNWISKILAVFRDNKNWVFDFVSSFDQVACMFKRDIWCVERRLKRKKSS